MALEVANQIKERGMQLFRAGNFEQASKKFVKALRCKFTPNFFISKGILTVLDRTDLDRHMHLDLEKRDLALEAQHVSLRLSLLLNSCLASLKVGGTAHAETVIKHATRALNLDGNPEKEEMTKELSAAEKAKALYRRAMARAILKDDAEAIKDLEAAQQEQPADGGIQKELAAAKQRVEERKKKQRAAYAKMFN